MENPPPAKERPSIIKLGCGFVFILGALVMVSSILSDDKPSTATPSEPAAPPMAVTASELAKAYAANEVAAQQRFDGHRLAVSGTIDSIDLGLGDEPILHLRGNDAFQRPAAHLNDEEKPKIATLAKGQKVNLLCESVSEVISAPQLKDCTLR